MKNKFKMCLFNEHDNALRERITKPLPQEFSSYNTIILSDDTNKLYDMILLTPSDRDISRPISFDILFLTGKYAGLNLTDVKPKVAHNPYLKIDKKSELVGQDAIISPARYKIQPHYYDNQYYYFELGDYKSMIMDAKTIYNCFKEIRSWDTLTLDYAENLIKQFNDPEMIDKGDIMEN